MIKVVWSEGCTMFYDDRGFLYRKKKTETGKFGNMHEPVCTINNENM